MDTAKLEELVKLQKKAESSKAVKKAFYDKVNDFIHRPNAMFRDMMMTMKG